MIWQCKPTLLAISVMLLSGCASDLNSSQRMQVPNNMPQQWQQEASSSVLKIQEQWLTQLQNPTLNKFVQQALKNTNSFCKLATM